RPSASSPPPSATWSAEPCVGTMCHSAGGSRSCSPPARYGGSDEGGSGRSHSHARCPTGSAARHQEPVQNVAEATSLDESFATAAKALGLTVEPTRQTGIGGGNPQVPGVTWR